MIAAWISGVIMVALLAGGNWLIHGKRVGFNPWLVMMAAWAVSIFLYLINPFNLFPLHARTWLLIGSSLTAFTAGYWLTWFARATLVIPPSSRSIPAFKLAAYRSRPILLLWRCSLIWFCFFFSLFILNAVKDYGANPFTFIQRLRPALAETGAPVGYYYFYAAQLLVPLGLLMWKHGRPRRSRYLCAATASLASLWFASGRTNITIAVTWAAAVLLLEWGTRPIRIRLVVASLLSVAGLLAVFVVMGDSLGKTFVNSPLSQVDLGLFPRSLVSPYLYETASLPALDGTLYASPMPGGTTIPRGYVFRAVYQIEDLLGLNTAIPKINLSYWATPYPFNTVTFLPPLLSEFGTWWTLVIVFLLGCLASLTYLRWLVAPSIGTVLLVSLCIVVLSQSTIAFRAIELWFIVEASALLAVVWAEKRQSLRYGSTASDVMPRTVLTSPATEHRDAPKGPKLASIEPEPNREP